MYFPFFKPQHESKRSAIQPQTIYSEFPYAEITKAQGGFPMAWLEITVNTASKDVEDVAVY